MVKTLSRKMVDWQTNKGFLLLEERKIYEYAYEIFIVKVFCILMTCVIAYLFHYYFIFLYMLSYMPLRTYAGGFHAKTNEYCIAFSVILLCIVCVCGKYLMIFNFMQIVLFLELLAIAIILILSPVEDFNKPLDDEERVKYRKYAYMVALIEVIVAAILYLFKIVEVSGIIMFAHIVLATMLVAGRIKNHHIRRKQK